MTTDIATITELPVAAIGSEGNVRAGDVEDGPDFAELVASIQERGVLVPVLVTEGHRDDGRQFVLVDGHRRLAAARAAGLDRIPARVVDTEDQADASVLAMVANLRRADLGPVEEADAYARILQANGWTQKRLAESLGVSPDHISRRLKLSRLPQGARAAIASGDVPLMAVPVVEQVAEISPAIAEVLVTNGAGELRDASDAADILRSAAWERKQDHRAGRASDAPFMYALSSYRTVEPSLGGFGLRPADHAELAKLWSEKLGSADHYATLSLMEDPETLRDQARAYGCLLEVDGQAFITDEAWLADRVRAALEAYTPPKSSRAAASTGAGAATDVKEQRAIERESARIEALAAGERNEALEQLLRTAFSGADWPGPDAIRLVAAAALTQISQRAALVFSDLHTVTRSGKPGKERAKTNLTPPDEVRAWLVRWVMEPGDQGAILNRLVQVLLAGYLADDRALPASGRPYEHLARDPLRSVLAAAPDELDPALAARFEERHKWTLRDESDALGGD